jgi:hypothetical protein
MKWLDGELGVAPVRRRLTLHDRRHHGLVGIDWGRVTKTRMPPECANLIAWHERCSSRPSAKA